MAERILRWLGVVPLVAALIAAGQLFVDLIEPRMAAVDVEPRCEAASCEFAGVRRGPAAEVQLVLEGPVPERATWEVCRGKTCRPAIAAVRFGRVELPAAGVGLGETLTVRLRGGGDLKVRSARMVPLWAGWGTALRRSFAVW